MASIKTLSVDIETYSGTDLAKSGVYKYAEDPDFEVLLFGYAVDGGEVHVVDLALGEKIPADIAASLTDENVLKYAFNANFERVCVSRHLGMPTGEYLDPSSWRCTMVWAAYMGLPLSLQGVGAVLNLDKQKLTEGKDLIKYFCSPCTPTKSNGGRTRNRPEDAPEKWTLFKSYNLRDVETEMGIQQKLSKFPVPEFVWDEYHIDQEINDRGVRLDLPFVEAAIEMDGKSRKELLAAMRRITELENPNSVSQMRSWLADNGLETDTLSKKAVSEMLKSAPPEIAEALLLRQQLAKSSVKKYQAMRNTVCSDGRARGMFFFYGANRTGRFAGRLVQLQNLPQNHLPDLAAARELVRIGDFEVVKMLYEDVPDTLSQLIRTAFIPREGAMFYVADFSAIEARVIAWFAGEQWVLDTFASGGDIYCATASRMFGVPVEKHGVNAELRQKGKQATLSCGYGGSVGALKAMGAIEAGMKEEELQPLVTAWRNANPNIVKLWWDMDKAVKKAVTEKTSVRVSMFRVYCHSGMLFIDLPSGRRLCYVKPKIGMNRYGLQSVTYEGTNNGKWERIESYGPKIIENCIAKGTLIVTNHGVKYIENLSDDDLLWDGIEWVSHEGLIYKGVRRTVNVSGIHMTHEHKILTEKGMVECAKSTGLNWADIQPPDSDQESGEHPTGKISVALPLHLRKRKGNIGEGSYCNVPCKILRVLKKGIALTVAQNPRNESSSCVGGVAFDETAVYGSESSRIQKLWWTGYRSVSRQAGMLREFLERYGCYLSERIGIRQGRQQQRLLQRKLQVDNTQDKLQESPKLPVNSYSGRSDDSQRIFRKIVAQCDHSSVPSEQRLSDRIAVIETGYEEPVYDIKNCGTRHRFAVYAEGNIRIVSNCTQAVSRDILCYAMKTLRNCSIVMHIHDELVIEADPRISLDDICEQMGRTPPWAKGLLLRADGYTTEFYKKD